jgi:hypothetical protein
MAERLAEAGATVLGIILAATPVALWVAWTPALLGAVLLAALVCSALLILLAECAPDRDQSETGAQGLREGDGIPGAIVEEVHGVFPLIYHHSGRRNSRFRHAMERVSRLIEGRGRGANPR